MSDAGDTTAMLARVALVVDDDGRALVVVEPSRELQSRGDARYMVMTAATDAGSRVRVYLTPDTVGKLGAILQALAQREVGDPWRAAMADPFLQGGGDPVL